MMLSYITRHVIACQSFLLLSTRSNSKEIPYLVELRAQLAIVVIVKKETRIIRKQCFICQFTRSRSFLFFKQSKVHDLELYQIFAHLVRTIELGLTDATSIIFFLSDSA